MLNVDAVLEERLLSSDEIAMVVAQQREVRGWTQETLAEIARVTVRTVQRVESGAPSSTDTRRALAGALEWDDLDAFNKVWSLPNYERLKAEQERLERETVAVAVEPISSGRQLRGLADQAEGWQHSQLNELPPSAAETFATLQDYFQDYGDIRDCYSAAQKLDVDRDFKELIDSLASEGIALCAGTRRVQLRDGKGPLDLTITVVHVLAGPTGSLPTTLRVPRAAKMDW